MPSSTPLRNMSRRARGLALLWAPLWAMSCGRTEQSAPRVEPAPSAASVAATVVAVEKPPLSGAALMERFECARCHKGLLPRQPPEKECVGCHERVHQDLVGGDASLKRRWKKNVRHLKQVPLLEDVAGKFRPEWLTEFLLEPKDLRPHLEETMPRFNLNREEATALAAWLTREPPAEPAASAPARGTVEHGREIYQQKRCGQCHEFAGVMVGELSAGAGERFEEARRLAPDLKWARERMTRAAIARWLKASNAIWPLRLMPVIQLSADEVDALTTFILEAPVQPPAPPVMEPRLPLLTRPVTYAEVEREVFHRTCWHCHSEPNYARGDGGPGNTGGFGFAGVRLSFLSYETVLAGYREPSGAPASLFRKNAEGTPRLVEALLARKDEERGQPRPAVRGMPLGLPSLRPEQIQLVETWVAQGRRP